jgi:rhamnulokinase
VLACCAHDTASAVAAIPATNPDFAYISSGTWSLVGLEVPAPVVTEQAFAFDIANERGIGGTTRLLKNVMGLWLLQQCRLAWGARGSPQSYEALTRMAAAARPDGPIFDPDRPELLAPGDMPARIAGLCRATGQAPPEGPAETVRAILESLACKYRLVLERIEAAADQSAGVVHVIGGGARNGLLCQLTADMLGRPLLAGPAEASAIGNILVQALGAGCIDSRGAIREVSARSVRTTRYVPTRERHAVDATYARFCSLFEAPAPAEA